MSKKAETDAFNEFVKKLKTITEKEPGGSYFSELLEGSTPLIVARNIADDFPAFSGIFVSAADYEKVKQERDTALRHDIRVLLRRRNELRQANDADLSTVKKREENIDRITRLIETGQES